MSFTYDTATDIGKIRLELGDVTANSGVKPTRANFTDEELQIFLDREGTAMRAVAGACEALARWWSIIANTTVGSRSEQLGEVAKRWAEQAKELRAQHGGSAVVCTAGVIRVDGYSDDIPSDDTTPRSEFTSDDWLYVYA